MAVKIFKDIDIDDATLEIISHEGNYVLCDSEDEADIKILSSEETNIVFDKYSGKISNEHQAYVNSNHLDTPILKKLFENFLHQNISPRGDITYEGFLISNNTLKVVDRAYYGLYTDFVCSDADEHGFNTRPLRKLLVNALLAFDTFSLLKEVTLPLHIDYGRAQGAYYCQFVALMNPSFRREIFLKSITLLLRDSDTVEVHFCKKTSKVVVRSFWKKERSSQWPSFFIFHEKSFCHNELSNDEATVPTAIPYDVNSRPIEDKSEIFEEVKGKKKWKVMRKVIESTLLTRDDYKVTGKDFPQIFDSETLRNLLSNSQDVEHLDSLNDEELDIVIFCLNEDNALDELKRMRHEEMIEVDPQELMESICTKVEKTDEEELQKIEGSDHLSSENERVRGKISEDEEKTLVKGSQSNLSDIQRVSGNGGPDDENSVWKVKKLNVVENLKNKYAQMENPAPEAVEEKLEEALKEELAASDTKLNAFVSDIVDAISEELLPATVPNSKYINKTMGSLKGTINNAKTPTVQVASLDLKLMISFTEKLLRKGNNYQRRLKHESEKNQYLKQQVQEVGQKSLESVQSVQKDNPVDEQLKKAHERIVAEKEDLESEKNELKARILQLEREVEIKNSEQVSDTSTSEEVTPTQVNNQEVIDNLRNELQGMKAEALDFKRQAKINETEVIKLRTQLTKVSKMNSSIGSDSDSGGKSSVRVKQLEKMNEQFQAGKNKAEKELAEKKSEIHKINLDRKTLTNKVKSLEKKLSVLSRRKAS